MKKKVVFLSFTLSLCMLLCGCAGSSLCAYSTYAYFDTLTRWAYFSRAADKEREVWAQITAFADSVEKSLSLAQPQSAVSRFNAAAAGETVEIDKIAYDVLKLAQEAYAQTDGAYNPAVGIYIDLWGFSPRCTSANYRPTLPYDRADYTAQLPDEKYVEAFRPLTDFSAVRVWEEEGAYYVYKPDLAVEEEGEIFTMALNLGGIAKGYAANVLMKDSLAECHKQVLADFGKCDILINGAGGNNPKAQTDKEYYENGDIDADTKSFFDLDETGVEFVFNLNFLGTLLPTQEFAKDMLGRKGCSVLNISSMNAYTPLTKIPAYSGAKAAVSNFTQWLAVHFSKMNIRVNAIAPGFFSTKQNAALLWNADGTPTPRTGKILAATPMNRFGEAEELLGSVLFLVSDKAAGFITGVVLPIDGGFSAYSGV